MPKAYPRAARRLPGIEPEEALARERARVAQEIGLLVPPGWGPRRPWPPSVESAEAKAQATPRGLHRSPLAGYSLAGALAVRGHLEGLEADLMEASRYFLAVAEHSPGYRLEAIWGAGVTLSLLPARTSGAFAARLIGEVVREAGAVALPVLRGVAQRVVARLEPIFQPEPLRWGWQGSWPVLIPTTSLAGERVQSLSGPICGTWEGCRGTLLDRGLLAPSEPRVRPPVTLEPKPTYLLARSTS